jgi:hypothetical protein
MESRVFDTEWDNIIIQCLCGPRGRVDCERLRRAYCEYVFYRNECYNARTRAQSFGEIPRTVKEITR